MTHKPRLHVKTADDCNNSHCVGERGLWMVQGYNCVRWRYVVANVHLLKYLKLLIFLCTLELLENFIVGSFKSGIFELFRWYFFIKRPALVKRKFQAFSDVFWMAEFFLCSCFFVWAYIRLEKRLRLKKRSLITGHIASKDSFYGNK